MSGFFFSLSRYKLKFSPDKVDTMIVQAICKLPSYMACGAPLMIKGFGSSFVSYALS